MEDNELNGMCENWKTSMLPRFQKKIFVRSSGTEDDREIKEKSTKFNIEVKGEVSKFYEEVISQPSTAKEIEKKKKPKLKIKGNKTPKREFNKNELFRFAMLNDIKGVKKLINECINIDLNATDNFGWTSLMISACENASEVFKFLLDLGADLSIKDKQNNTAKSLAEKKRHASILEIIESKENPVKEEDIDIQTIEDELKVCPDCGVEFKKSTSKTHHSSTVHLFSCKYDTKSKINSFGISRSSRGFQLLERVGWDGNSALGARENGKLFPVQTTLRKPRSGLGTKQDKSKVTHFEPYDLRAIKRRLPIPTLTRKEIIENSLKDKRKTQNLRAELS